MEIDGTEVQTYLAIIHQLGPTFPWFRLSGTIVFLVSWRFLISHQFVSTAESAGPLVAIGLPRDSESRGDLVLMLLACKACQ